MHEHGTKATPGFLTADVSLLPGSTVQPENTYSQILKVWSEKAKKGQTSTVITVTASVHLPKPLSTDLTMKPESVLTNPKMECKAGQCKTSIKSARSV